MKEALILVDVINAVVSSMTVAGVSYINFEPGRSIQIMKSLDDANNSITYKGTKYPLIAMLLPSPTRRGKSILGYGMVTIPRIVIATLVKDPDGMQSVLKRFEVGGTFKDILYPCYYEFLIRTAQSPNVIGGDPESFEHTFLDNPGQQPIGEGLTDYVDSVEILNLQLNLSQLKTC